MSFTACPQWQTACIRKLRTNDHFTHLVKGGVHDATPAAKIYPYAVVDEPIETPDDCFGERGHIISGTISVFTTDGTKERSGRGAAGYEEAQRIIELICELLTDDNDPLYVEGHHVVTTEFDQATWERESDGTTRRGEIDFTVTLDDA